MKYVFEIYEPRKTPLHSINVAQSLSIEAIFHFSRREISVSLRDCMCVCNLNEIAFHDDDYDALDDACNLLIAIGRDLCCTPNNTFTVHSDRHLGFVQFIEVRLGLMGNRK